MSNIIEQAVRQIAPHYSGINELTVRQFIKVETLLYMFLKLAGPQDANSAYLLLSGLNLIGKKDFDADDYLMFNARNVLKEFKSKVVWEEYLKKYRSISEPVRYFDFSEDNIPFVKNSENVVYPGRIQVYEQLITSGQQMSCKKAELAKPGERYTFKNDREIETVVIPDIAYPANGEEISRKGGAIKVSLQELKKTAEEMDQICLVQGNKSIRSNWSRAFDQVIIKKVRVGSIEESGELTISELCNIVGMVGAGKSTLMNILSYWAAKQGYRILIILDSVAEVIKAVEQFCSFDICVTPLLGRFTRYDQLDKVINPGEMYLDENTSKYLTALCPLDGLRPDGSDRALDYGDEPCFNLKKKNGGNKDYVCPFYFRCPAKENERKIATASIIVTTPAGFVYGRTPFPVTGRKERIAEYVLRNFDLVIFDESDRIQVNFDSIFCPTTSIDELVSMNANAIKEFMEAEGTRLDMSSNERRFINGLVRLPQLCDVVKQQIIDNEAISNWGQIGRGKSFSAQTLLVDDTDISAEICEQLLQFIAGEDVDDSLQRVFLRIENDGDDPENSLLIDTWLTNFDELKKTIKLRIRFLFYLISLEKRLRYVSDFGMTIGFDTDAGRKVAGFLRNNFHELQKYLPASAMGNIFGFVYDKNKKVLRTFRQFAFGRSLMLSLPFMRFDENGQIDGPNVLLFSGTSWAKGSTKYHICAPVNYILETGVEIRNRISNSDIIVIPSETRVSGSGQNERHHALREVLETCEGYIRHEIGKLPSSRILFIVNSYVDAEIAQQQLAEMIPGYKTARMVKDEAEHQEMTLRRGEVWRFFKTDYKMLIAPAGAIERGHNIVDDVGHAALTSVFFLTRPMSKPGEIEELLPSLNGMVSEYADSVEMSGSFERMKHLRSFAAQKWKAILGRPIIGLDYLSQEEKTDIAVARLVIIHQIFGRLARIVDLERPAPSVYFADGAFLSKDKDGFSLLNEMMQWLQYNIEEGPDKHIAETLYGPFYQACLRGAINE